MWLPTRGLHQQCFYRMIVIKIKRKRYTSRRGVTTCKLFSGKVMPWIRSNQLENIIDLIENVRTTDNAQFGEGSKEGVYELCGWNVIRMSNQCGLSHNLIRSAPVLVKLMQRPINNESMKCIIFRSSNLMLELFSKLWI